MRRIRAICPKTLPPLRGAVGCCNGEGRKPGTPVSGLGLRLRRVQLRPERNIDPSQGSFEPGLRMVQHHRTRKFRFSLWRPHSPSGAQIGHPISSGCNNHDPIGCLDALQFAGTARRSKRLLHPILCWWYFSMGCAWASDEGWHRSFPGGTAYTVGEGGGTVCHLAQLELTGRL